MGRQIPLHYCLGNGLEPLDEQFKTEEWKVRGCQSQVWLLPSRQGDKIHFRGDSDAVIVKGLIAIVLMIYSDKSPSEIKAVAVKIFLLNWVRRAPEPQPPKRFDCHDRKN